MKVRMGQIQTQIAAMEAERKRMLEVFEREAIQRCIQRLPLSRDLKTLLMTLPSAPSECHRLNCRRYASALGESSVEAGKEMQRTREGEP